MARKYKEDMDHLRDRQGEITQGASAKGEQIRICSVAPQCPAFSVGLPIVVGQPCESRGSGLCTPGTDLRPDLNVPNDASATRIKSSPLRAAIHQRTEVRRFSDSSYKDNPWASETTWRCDNEQVQIKTQLLCFLRSLPHPN